MLLSFDLNGQSYEKDIRPSLLLSELLDQLGFLPDDCLVCVDGAVIDSRLHLAAQTHLRQIGTLGVEAGPPVPASHTAEPAIAL